MTYDDCHLYPDDHMEADHAAAPNYTQMPVAGLDDLTPERIARELRGAVYQAQTDLRNAEKGGNMEAIRQARAALADRIQRCRAEHIALGPVVRGELFAWGYTREAAGYEQRTRE